MLTAHLLPQEQDYVTPFDRRALGFRSDWWDDYFRNTRNPDHRPYSFTDHTGVEAARALTRERAGFTDLEGAGISLPSRAVSVDFIEVRADLRYPRQGIGAGVVRLLEALHPQGTLFAFSEGADEFWNATGWQFIARADADERMRPLFVLTRD